MKISIYQKFIFIYLLISVLCFAFTATFASDMFMEHITTKKADTLYQEATYLSTGYAEDYYRSQTG